MPFTSSSKFRVAILLAVLCLGALIMIAVAPRFGWGPPIATSETGHEAHEHAGHVHEHDHDDDHSGHRHEAHEHAEAEHHETAILELSERGLKNIGFEPFTVEQTDYARQLSLPAIVVERPGRSQIHITAPLTGIVTRILAVTGEAVGPGESLFELRLTHEELVAAQREFLETIASLEVVEREIERLKGLGEGVIAGKRILEQQYEKQRLEVSLMAAEQAMLLHGLTEQQIQEVRQSRRLFRNITIRTPEHGDIEEACEGPHLFTVQRLAVAKGEHVELGRGLATLADHCELHIEALAFEDDASKIRAAAEAERKVTATLLEGDAPGGRLRGLEILYVAGQIEAESRALKVYVQLPNRIALDKSTAAGKRFVEWVYKPGQRMEVNVPVDTWEDQLVLPTTAVVEEDAEAYAYRQHGDHFEQVPVHILYRDQNAVVIAKDGALFPGDVVAGKGAFQMHLALKNNSGGGIDPHAGHNH